jgi:hypothetical protein
VLGAVAKADTDITTNRVFAVGRTDDTEVSAFADGCPVSLSHEERAMAQAMECAA